MLAPGARRALIVAHPDDETLFFGGLVIAFPGDWTIICCSIPVRDPVRAWKFFDACEVLGAKARLLPFREDEVFSRLTLAELNGFDEVVTHNAAGEYGHPHHKAVHSYVSARAAGAVWTGCYGMPESGPLRIELSAAQYERKLAALRCYDHTSSLDSSPKWRALIDRYGSGFDLGVETYARHRTGLSDARANGGKA